MEKQLSQICLIMFLNLMILLLTWEGNIGKALSSTSESLKKNYQDLSWLNIELSSYQIESSPKVAPTIGIWTTFTPDHLERHHDIRNLFPNKA